MLKLLGQTGDQSLGYSLVEKWLVACFMTIILGDLGWYRVKYLGK